MPMPKVTAIHAGDLLTYLGDPDDELDTLDFFPISRDDLEELFSEEILNFDPLELAACGKALAEARNGRHVVMARNPEGFYFGIAAADTETPKELTIHG